MQAVRDQADASVEQRTEQLSKVLSHNFKLREMDWMGLRISTDRKSVCIGVPAESLDADDDEQITQRMMLLPRYAIIARAAFGDMFDPIRVAELNDEGQACQLQAEFSTADLVDYADEQAGLLDLINDAIWWMEGEPIEVRVDFEAVKSAEDATAQRPFPRKTRPSP